MTQRGLIHQDERPALQYARILRVVTVAAHERYL
jgi:hypothetical protein